MRASSWTTTCLCCRTPPSSGTDSSCSPPSLPSQVLLSRLTIVVKWWANWMESLLFRQLLIWCWYFTKIWVFTLRKGFSSQRVERKLTSWPTLWDESWNEIWKLWNVPFHYFGEMKICEFVKYYSTIHMDNMDNMITWSSERSYSLLWGSWTWSQCWTCSHELDQVLFHKITIIIWHSYL